MLTHNAGALKNNGIRELVSAGLKHVIDNQPRDQLKATLRTMQQLDTTYDFETALYALSEGIRINRSRFCDTAVLAARINEYGLDTAAESRALKGMSSPGSDFHQI